MLDVQLFHPMPFVHFLSFDMLFPMSIRLKPVGSDVTLSPMLDVQLFHPVP